MPFVNGSANWNTLIKEHCFSIAEKLVAGTENLYADAISAAEHQLFHQILEHTGGNQLQAAGILGISRVALRSKLRALGIDPADYSS